MNVLSLFAGIGGLELGLERAGMTVVGQVEIDPFCRAVLDTHWPEVPKHDDARTAARWWTAADRPPVHVVAGGPPCQPASRAGHRLGDADPRWGWPWLIDTVRAVCPRYVIVENPAALLDLDGGRPFGWILAELASLGFDADWSVLSACAVGAPHTRERLFLMAHADRVNGRARLGLEADERWRDRPCTVRAAGGGERSWRGDPLGLAAPRSAVGVVDGVPDPLESARVHALGNAVVPAVAERVGRYVMTGRWER